MAKSPTSIAAAALDPACVQQSEGPLQQTAQNDLLQLLECDEVTVVFLDPDLRIRRMAEATKRLLDLEPTKPPRSLGDLADRMQRQELLSDARQALETGETVVRHLQLPQRETHLTLRFYPSRSTSGEVDGLLLGIVDTTERWKANSVSRHLAAIVRYSDDAILSKDLNGIITSWNLGAERLFGYGSDETIGMSVTLLIPEGMPDEEPGILQRIRRGEAIDHYQTIRRRKDGSLIDVSLCVSPVLDNDGKVIGASKIARDITLEKHAQRQRDVLINELNHRVKNTLATVQSIAYQSMRYASSMDTFAESFNSRLLALSKTQDLLTSGNWISASLRDLVLLELAPYRTEASTVGLSGDDIQLHPRMMMDFGMMVHELTTNAVKYGALSRPGGHVEVSWKMEKANSSGRLRFSWVESGGPPISGPPERKGMGSRLLAALAGGLDGIGDLEYSPTGVRYVLDVPWKTEGYRA